MYGVGLCCGPLLSTINMRNSCIVEIVALSWLRSMALVVEYAYKTCGQYAYKTKVVRLIQQKSQSKNYICIKEDI